MLLAQGLIDRVHSIGSLPESMLFQRAERLTVDMQVFKRRRSFARLTWLGNQARDVKQWLDATRYYEQALALRPDAFGVWVQLGHSRKELGKFDEAAAAYRHAERLRPDDVDLQVQFGHLHNLRGEADEALRRYQEAVRRGSNDGIALNCVGRTSGIWNRNHPLEQAAGVSPVIPDHPGPVLYFDYSDLILHFRRNRFPTGIQRVQLELFKASMEWEGTAEIRSCAYSSSIGMWTDINPLAFRRLCEMASDTTQDDATWADASRGFIDRLERQGPSRLPADATLVNVGTSWWMPNYMQTVRAMKLRAGLRYVPLVFDLVPMLHPELLDGNFGPTFNAWLSGVFLQADATIAISANTASDLTRASTAVKPLDIEPLVVALDADFGSHADGVGDRSEDANTLERFGLTENGFVLFVGTLEIRKNHRLVFQAWLRLLDQEGAARVPTLVCVGKKGWRFEDADALLRTHPELRAKVVLLSGVSDDELRALFTCCLFTVYASIYEGWGLPVTESLAHGRVCLTANNSSLPEAGTQFADYYETDSPTSFANAARRLIFDQSYRRKRESMIADKFKSRSWIDLLDALVHGLLLRISTKPSLTSYAAPVKWGVTYPVAFHSDLRRPSAIVGVGEMLRSGQTWHEMEEWGTWAAGHVGRLSFAVPEGAGAVPDAVLYLKVRAATDAVTLVVEQEKKTLARVKLAANDRTLLSVRLAAPTLGKARSSEQPVTVSLRVDRLIETDVHGRTKPVGIGIESFALCQATQAAERLDVLERCWMRVAPVSTLGDQVA